MDGVTVLNQYETSSGLPLGISIFLIGVISIVIIVSIVLLIVNHDFIEFADVILIFVLISLAAVMLFAIISATNLEATTRYEVTVDKSVSLQKFTEHYEIVEQRGDIYVVEEKE